MEKVKDTGGEDFFDLIRANYVQLQRDLNVSRIVPFFFQNKLLELDDMDEIKSKNVESDKVDCFLRKCFRMTQLKAYETFIYALKELNHDHIMKIFQGSRESYSASVDATIQAESRAKTIEKDVEVQTDLTCFSDNSFVCMNCRRHSFSESIYDDGKSLNRASEDEHGYTLLLPRENPEREFQKEPAACKIGSDKSSTIDEEKCYKAGLFCLTKAMSERSVTYPDSEDMNHQDLTALKEEVRKLEGWRPDVNESNVMEKAGPWKGRKGYYFLWWHKRSKRDSMTQSTRSSMSHHGRFIVSVWGSKDLLHYKILDKLDEKQQWTYYVDKSFSFRSISELIANWKYKGISVKEDRS